MSAGGMYLGGTYKRRIIWAEVPGIYRARFLRLWRVMKLSLLASVIALATVVLLPAIFGIALFSAHVLLTVVIVSAAFLFAGWLYWKSLKLALGGEDH